MCWWALFHGGGSQDVLTFSCGPHPETWQGVNSHSGDDVAFPTCCSYYAVQPLQPPWSAGSGDSHLNA